MLIKHYFLLRSETKRSVWWTKLWSQIICDPKSSTTCSGRGTIQKIFHVGCASSSFERSVKMYCFAALDLRAYVEQSFDCLVVQNCPAVQSMGEVWWIRYRRTTRSTVCSSAPHSQAAEGALTNLCKNGRKCPTQVRRPSCYDRRSQLQGLW